MYRCVCISGGCALVCVGSALVKLPLSDVVARLGLSGRALPSLLLCIPPTPGLLGGGSCMLVIPEGIVLPYCGFNVHSPGNQWGGERMRCY